jgi:hypothetical protein
MIFVFSDISLKQCTWQLYNLKRIQGKRAHERGIFCHIISRHRWYRKHRHPPESEFTPSVFQEHVILCITIGQRPRKASKQPKTFGRPSSFKLLHIRSVVCPKSQTKHTFTKKNVYSPPQMRCKTRTFFVTREARLSLIHFFHQDTLKVR